jgi:hypothetical protein
MAFLRLSLSFLLLIVAFVVHSPAYAQSVYLLQLGSFPSEKQANERWQSLLSKHPDIFSGLSLRVAQVALPPDNSIIYRTQAGPIESRSDATEACKKLASSRDECFVVETAMFAGQESTAAIAPITSAPETAPKPAEQPALVQSQVEQPVAVPAPQQEMPNPPEPVELVERPAPSQPIIQRDERGRIIVPSAPLMAAGGQNPGNPRQASGFLPNLQAGTQESQAREPIQDVPPETNLSARTGTVTQPQDVMISQNATPLDLMPPASPVQDAPPAQEIAPVTVVVPPPVVTESAVRPRITSRPIANAANSGGVEVDVAEAIRVPLSGGEAAQQRPSRIETRPLGAGGYPSQAMQQKSIWVQINYFSNQENALSFFDDFRYANRDVTAGLRARITQPYFFARSNRVSLRVGPFADNDLVRKLCDAATTRELNCALVRDVGSSVAANTPRDRRFYRGYEEQTRMQNWSQQPGGPSNWVQLGSFNSPAQAWGAWERIRNSNSDLLEKMGADVNTANMSSSSAQVFRLRAGPFMTKMAARNLCDRLEGRGVSCVTVNSR